MQGRALEVNRESHLTLARMREPSGVCQLVPLRPPYISMCRRARHPMRLRGPTGN